MSQDQGLTDAQVFTSPNVRCKICIIFSDKLQKAIRYGVVTAALVLSQWGDQTVTTRDEIETLLEATGSQFFIRMILSITLLEHLSLLKRNRNTDKISNQILTKV